MRARWTYGFSAYANLPPEPFVQRCLTLLGNGFGAMEVFAVGDMLEPTAFEQYSRSIAQVCSQIPVSLSVHLPTTDVNVLARNRRVAEASLESQRQAIRWAQSLGARLAVLHLGTAAGVSGSPGAAGPQRFGRFWPQAQAALADLAACAQQSNVLLTIENLIGPAEVAASPDHLLALLESPGCQGVRLTVDLSHALLAGYALTDFLPEVSPSMVHIHANDTDLQGDRHWPLGQGVLPLREAADTLCTLGFSGTFLLEIDGPVDVLQNSRLQVEAAMP